MAQSSRERRARAECAAAVGFVHPVHEGLLKTLGVDLDQRGNVRANLTGDETSRPNVFSAGDMRRGQSLVVWTIREGRLCARAIDGFLTGSTKAKRYPSIAV